MKLPLSNLLSVKIKYTFQQHGHIYWQRKIPKDLQTRYGTTAPIKINLETNDWRIAARKVERLNNEHEALWEAMRGNPDLQPMQIRDAALGLLQQHQLKPYPHQNHEEALYRFADSLDSKAIRYAQGDEEVYRETPPEAYLTPSEREAIKLLQAQPKPLLSSALEVYLGNHPKGNNEDFRTDSKRVWDKVVSIIGDKPIESLRREDVTGYRNRLLSEGVKTGTVRRRLNTASAIFNSAIKELEIQRLNPFEGIKIAGEGEDAEEGQPLHAQQLQTLKTSILSKDDSLRWALALQMDLGTRLAEVIGLALDDIKLDTDTPHVAIQYHPWRSLKNKQSIRKVPLVGMALWAAQQIKNAATSNQVHAFPQYNKTEKTNTDSASAALNKYIRSLGIERTTHDLRHTMRDRLREVGAPKDIQDSIGGWSRASIGENYGEGYSLRVLKEWLEKVVIPA